MEVECHRIMDGGHRCTRAVFGASHANRARRARSFPRTRWRLGRRSGRPTRPSTLLLSRTATTARSTRCPPYLCVRLISEAMTRAEAAYVRTRSGAGSGGLRASGEPDTVAGAPTHRAAAGCDGCGCRLVASRDAWPSGLEAVLPRLAYVAVRLPHAITADQPSPGHHRGMPASSRESIPCTSGSWTRARVGSESLWSPPRLRGSCLPYRS